MFLCVYVYIVMWFLNIDQISLSTCLFVSLLVYHQDTDLGSSHIHSFMYIKHSYKFIILKRSQYSIPPNPSPTFRNLFKLPKIKYILEGFLVDPLRIFWHPFIYATLGENNFDRKTKSSREMKCFCPHCKSIKMIRYLYIFWGTWN